LEHLNVLLQLGIENGVEISVPHVLRIVFNIVILVNPRLRFFWDLEHRHDRAN